MKQEFKEYVEAKFKEINNANYYVKYLDMQDEVYRLTNRIHPLEQEIKRLKVFESKTMKSLADAGPALTLHEIEKRTVLNTLKYFEDNKVQTAEALGITTNTLYNKLYGYGEFE